MNITEYRQQLDIADNGLYLNYAATSPVSRATAARMGSEIELMTQPLGARFYDALNQIENTRRLIAELINTNPRNIAFTLNTSMAISTLALSVRLGPGDVVLVPDDEFPSNYFPWLNLKSKGVTCRTFTPGPRGSLVDDLMGMDLSDVRLISISAVSYATGRLYELKDFTAFCRENNILSCLDAIQAIGSTSFDVKRIDPDFLCSGAQKWIMGPVGCGMLYARPSLLEDLDVPYVGWTSHKFPEYMELDSLDFPDEMTRFEPGLPNYVPVVGAGSALEQLNAVGWNTILPAIAQHSSYLRSSLKDAGFRLLVDDDAAVAGITSFYLPDGTSSRIVAELYEKQSIKITSRHGYVRVSPHFFNERPELDRFLNCTEDIFKRIRKSGMRSTEVELAASKPLTSRNIIVLGATGNLGRRLCDLLVKQGYSLFLVSRDLEKLNLLAARLRRTNITVDLQLRTVDFASADAVRILIDELLADGVGQYHALINSSGECHADLFHQLPADELGHQLTVNVEVPSRLMHLFLNTLKSPEAHGLMNIVSSTGRCGSPLLANYGASHAALWTLGESIGREWADTDLTVTTFVAPAMHSPLQKLMGRTALRYFRASGRASDKASGGFDYAEPDMVASQALNAFWNGEAIHVARPSRMKLWTNALLPRLVDRKLRGMWRQNFG